MSTLTAVEPVLEAVRGTAGAVARPFQRRIAVFLTARKYGSPQFFFCVYCGRKVFAFYSDVRLVVDGDLQAADQGSHNGLQLLCRTGECKTQYLVL